MWNFCKSHYVQSELGQIFSFRDFDIDTGAVKQAKNRPKMTLDGQNWQFHQSDHCYSAFSNQSHQIQSKLGQIYSLRALDINTRA